MTTDQTVIVGGIVYAVLAETQDVDGDTLLMIRRPNGVKEYVARRLPDHPLWGSGRAQILASASVYRYAQVPTDA